MISIKNKYKNSILFKSINSVISSSFRRRLHNRDFTILSSNCIAGVIYNRLGLQFLSPTINMFFTQPDFVEFCLNLDYYLCQPLQFEKSDLPYPVAVLKGTADIPTITLNFNHYKTEKEAEEKWESRKARINRDNLYIILYKLDGLTIEHAKKLENVTCSNKILLTATAIPEISWSFVIKPNNRQKYASSYLGSDILGIRWFEKKWDYVDFLNHKY